LEVVVGVSGGVRMKLGTREIIITKGVEGKVYAVDAKKLRIDDDSIIYEKYVEPNTGLPMIELAAELPPSAGRAPDESAPSPSSPKHHVGSSVVPANQPVPARRVEPDLRVRGKRAAPANLKPLP
jgi:hypothetical protein